MRRRAFIAGLGGAAVAWPLAARAQNSDLRRIGVLHVYDENDPEGKRRVSAFTQALSDLGWTDGRNLRMELRWGGNDSNRIRALAQQLVGLQPDVIVTGGGGHRCPPAGDANDPDRLASPSDLAKHIVSTAILDLLATAYGEEVARARDASGS
jgi:hypothetical protein